ncbi:MAG: GAD-like domain-containing protein [Mycobacterium sp.]
MRPEFLNFVSRWGEPIDPVHVPDSYFDEYGEQLPVILHDLWREIGFAGFGDGLLWVCDPHYWQPIVDAWLEGVELPAEYRGGQIPILRTAYGKIYCFKRELGQKLIINPVLSKISTVRPNPVAGQKWIDTQLQSILELPPHSFLLDADPPEEGDDLQEDMFPRIVEQLGSTGRHTVYTFAPRIQDGGLIRAEFAALADASDELRGLRALQTPRVGTI